MKITRKEILNLLGLIIFWRLLLQLFAFITRSRLSLNPDLAYSVANINPWPNTLPGWLSPFANWDSGWYLSIAERGYYFIDQTTNAVFFPLYPLLMRYVGKLTGLDYLTAGLIISQIAIIAAVIYLYQLIKNDYSQSIAWSSIVFLLIFPTAFFFTLVYTEALFICLVVMAFYYARENKWPIVGLLGFLLALTKPWGVALLIPLLVEYYESKKFNLKKTDLQIWYLTLIPLGLLLFMQYLKAKFGSYFIFMTGQKMWHDENTYNFFLTFKNYLSNIFIHISDNLPYQTAISLDLAFFTFGLMMSVYIFLKIRKSYGLFTFFTCLIPALTGIFVSMSRYLLVAFPIYLLLALWSEKNKLIQFLLSSICLMFISFFLFLFIHNYWVA